MIYFTKYLWHNQPLFLVVKEPSPGRPRSKDQSRMMRRRLVLKRQRELSVLGRWEHRLFLYLGRIIISSLLMLTNPWMKSPF